MSVTLVFTDRHTEQVTPERAIELCSDAATAGRIIDALTPDKSLQNALRLRMDNHSKI